MAVNGWQVRRFLLIQPRPSVVRLSGSDNVPQEIRVTQNRSWSRIGDTIAAIDPELIECLDKDGNLIRALRPNADVQRSDSAPLPPPAILNDPETARFTHVANLLHRAYEHSTEIAFTKLVELVERIDARSDAIESRLERTEANYRRILHEQVQDAFERAEELAKTSGGTEFKDQMLSSLLQGAMQGNAEGAAVNGKAKP
jgi:hypothetical protein